MRVLVDSSVWADFLNGYPTPQADALADLLAGQGEPCTCGVVAAEVFQGLRRDKGRDAIEERFRLLPCLEPSGLDLYLRAAEVYRKLRARGITVRSTIDCLVAVLAEANDCGLLARDRDLETIVESGLVGTRLWSAGDPSARG